MNTYEIIREPIITEKTTFMKDERQVLCFKVDRRATKDEIKRAVEEIFEVKVGSVRTLHVRGKQRRLGRQLGKRPDWKKAYVTLKHGSIEYFENI